jgi:alpha-glucosidase
MAPVPARRGVLHLYRRLIALRHRVPALSVGAFELLDLPAGLLGYRRGQGADEWTVVINFAGAAVSVDGASGELAGLRVEVSSDGAGEGRPFDGRIGADQAVVLRH